MSPKAVLAPYQLRDGSDESSDEGNDPEEVPMIEKGSSPRSRKWRENPRTTIAILSLLLLASLAGNALLLFYSLLQPQDLDVISVKHTSEYCR